MILLPSGLRDKAPSGHQCPYFLLALEITLLLVISALTSFWPLRKGSFWSPVPLLPSGLRDKAPSGHQCPYFLLALKIRLLLVYQCPYFLLALEIRLLLITSALASSPYHWYHWWESSLLLSPSAVPQTSFCKPYYCTYYVLRRGIKLYAVVRC